MTERDAFDRRLAEALRDYAMDAPTAIDALDLARSVVRSHPRRSGWPALVRTDRSALVWVLLGAALILASLLALAAVGSLLTRDERPRVDSRSAGDELYGDWQSVVPGSEPGVAAGLYTVNLNGPSLIRGPGETAVEWAGRATRSASLEPGAWELIVMSSGPCGDGRYVVRRYGVDGIRFTDAADDCADRVSILVGAMVWGRPAAVELVPGRTYGSGSFGEPFHFVMPGMDPSVPAGGDVRATAREWGGRGLMIGYGCCWSTWLIDDLPVNVDVCDYTKGTLADVPATPAAVGEWLRSSSRLTVSDPIELIVDGRTALRFDTQPRDDCNGREGSLMPPGFDLGTRLYAIPTGDDTIIYVVWSDPGSLPFIEAGADELVRSMTFE